MEPFPTSMVEELLSRSGSSTPSSRPGWLQKSESALSSNCSQRGKKNRNERIMIFPGLRGPREDPQEREPIMKIIGKIFAHLLAGILTLALVAFDLLGRALSFIGVFVILLYGLSLLVIVFKGLWHTLPILIGLFAVCLLVYYGTAWIAGFLSFLRDRLLGR